MSEVAATVARLPVRGMITLRGDLGAQPVADAVGAATGCAVPQTRRIVVAGDRAVAWMAPDELMLFLPPAAVGDARSGLVAALAGQHHLAVDVTDARVLFRIAGEGARDVLVKGAPIDLAPAIFGPGDFRRTRLGQVAAALWMPEAEVFELMCFRSVADFVGDWLSDAARPGSLPGYFRAG